MLNVHLVAVLMMYLLEERTEKENGICRRADYVIVYIKILGVLSKRDFIAYTKLNSNKCLITALIYVE